MDTLGNLKTRVESSYTSINGPTVGDNLLTEFKTQLIAQDVFKTMFGTNGERIFINQSPNINETITPGLLLSWKNEKFFTFDNYFSGEISALVILPVQLTGDFNSLRKVGQVFQRFIGGPMNLFKNVSGLIEFGYGTSFGYELLAKFDGFQCPAIALTIPFKFDLQLLKSQYGEFDFYRDLDDSDVGLIESILATTINSDGQDNFKTEVQIVTGQTN
jgi:hypothetical protein